MSVPDLPHVPATPGSLMRGEIAEQPEVLTRLNGQLQQPLSDLADHLRSHRPRFAMVCARGTSDHAALYAKYLFEVVLGVPTGLTSPSTFSVYGARVDFRDSLVVLVSQSGSSPDLLATEEAARAGGGLTVAVTNEPSSPLARAAMHHVHADAGPERAVAATKSYTAALLSLWLLVQHWRGEDAAPANAVAQGAAAAVDGVAQALAAEPATVELASHYRSTDRIIVTARGFDYPTAREAALKLTECCYLAGQAFSGADLVHGPIAQVDARTPVLAIAGPGRSGRAMAPVIEALAARGADLVVAGEWAGHTGVARHLALPSAHLPEELRPMVDVIPMQLLALTLSLQRGIDPDRPRGLAKVTRTW